MNGYRISITRDGGQLVGTVDIDGMNLDSAGGRMSLIEAIIAEMGGHAIAECAGETSPNTTGTHVIVCEDPIDGLPCFWSHTGWAALSNATTYSHSDMQSTSLPERGEWMSLTEARSL